MGVRTFEPPEPPELLEPFGVLVSVVVVVTPPTAELPGLVGVAALSVGGGGGCCISDSLELLELLGLSGLLVDIPATVDLSAGSGFVVLPGGGFCCVLELSPFGLLIGASLIVEVPLGVGL